MNPSFQRMFLLDQSPIGRRCIVLPLNPNQPAKPGQLVGEAKTIDGEPLYVVEYENGMRVRARATHVEFLVGADMTDRKVIRTTQRIVKPHATIANISYHLEKHAKDYEQGSSLFRMAGLVMEAFFIEGYATVVAQKLDNTEELMGTTGTKERIKAIFKAADPAADFGTRPYQSIYRLFVFRDNMAHPETEEHDEEIELTLDEANESIENIGWNLATETEEFCTASNSARVREDMSEVLKRTWHTEWESWPLDSGMQFVGHSIKQ